MGERLGACLLVLAACGSSGGDHADAAVDGDGDGFTVAGGDCDDSDPSVNPDADEVCDDDDVDEDCDGDADEDDPEGPTDGTMAWPDVDEDTYGDDAMARTYCVVPGDTIDRGGDCDDADPGAYPGALEACNGHVDDCNDDAWTLASEDGLVTWAPTDGARQNVTPSGTYAVPADGVLTFCPGTHTVNLVLGSVDAEVRSRGGDAAAAAETILDGDDAGSVVQAAFSSSTLRGLTLTNGSGTDLGTGQTFGGGVYAGASFLEIVDCVIADNTADFGGGIYAHSDAGGSQVTVSGTTIVRNTGNGVTLFAPSTVSGIATFGDGADENSPSDVSTPAMAYDFDGPTTLDCSTTGCK